LLNLYLRFHLLKTKLYL